MWQGVVRAAPRALRGSFVAGALLANTSAGARLNDLRCTAMFGGIGGVEVLLKFDALKPLGEEGVAGRTMRVRPSMRSRVRDARARRDQPAAGMEHPPAATRAKSTTHHVLLGQTAHGTRPSPPSPNAERGIHSAASRVRATLRPRSTASFLSIPIGAVLPQLPVVAHSRASL